MDATITLIRKPEEEELLRKRDELAAVQAVLAERELELTDFRLGLGTFEARYLREVGALYAALDDWKARIAELRAKHDPSGTAKQQAKEAREHARQTHQAANGEGFQGQ